MVAEVPAAREGNDARARGDDVQRAHQVREEARALLQQALEEALAPLHYAVRDLERRLVALEEAPRLAPAPPIAAPAPAQGYPRSQALIPPPAVVPVVQVAQVVVAPPAPRAPSFDWGAQVPFDGARRRRRVVGFFVMFLVLVFGALFGNLILSWMEPR